ncbi:hypothetical protein [Ralstonia pseudosolanacearum]|uniref:hypothetical protein n=1 Tax=Ralstonia pseudosolanacearum TaxID=1310165 RepID=UPI002675786B|nr:hypothetical protein [Ralstonia pseudosolanacearum]MDO3553274.1 hypothetical protein [Ralstonia pseudosolanacearum]
MAITITMGNGTFAMMQDVSVPRLVGGRHWGGLRMGYKATVQAARRASVLFH